MPFDPNTDTLLESKTKLKHPPQYQVLMHNDDFTTKEFVVYVLRTIFSKTEDEATQIMWHIHKNGMGVVGVYSYEIAETKVELTHELAQQEGYPLLCSLRAI